MQCIECNSKNAIYRKQCIGCNAYNGMYCMQQANSYHSLSQSCDFLDSMFAHQIRNHNYIWVIILIKSSRPLIIYPLDNNDVPCYDLTIFSLFHFAISGSSSRLLHSFCTFIATYFSFLWQ